MKKLKQLPKQLKELHEAFTNHEFYELGPRDLIPKGHKIIGMLGRYTYTAKKKKAKKNGGKNEQSQTS